MTQGQFSIAGCVAVVTGATRGIGRATAEVLGDAGARVVVVGRSSRAQPSAQMAGTVEDVVDELAARGIEAIGVAADLADPDQTAVIATRTLERFGRCDVLVNNAAYTTNAPLLDIPPHRWATAFRVQVGAPQQLVQAFVPGMLERGSGRVINVSSGASQSLMPYLSLYGTSKLAMERWNEFCHAELGGRGVTFNTLRVSELVRSEGFLKVLERQGEMVATGARGMAATMDPLECGDFVRFMVLQPDEWSGHTVTFQDLRDLGKQPGPHA